MKKLFKTTRETERRVHIQLVIDITPPNPLTRPQGQALVEAIRDSLKAQGIELPANIQASSHLFTKCTTDDCMGLAAILADGDELYHAKTRTEH